MRKDMYHVVHPDGSEEWFALGVRHRVDGPAVTRADGSEMWWYYGERHRVDGPAVRWADGSESWLILGQTVLSYNEYQHLTACSDETLILLKLKWGKMV